MSISDSITDIQIQDSMADSLIAPLDSSGNPIMEGAEDQGYGEQYPEDNQAGGYRDQDSINAELSEQTQQIEREQDSQREQYEQGQQPTEQPLEVSPQQVQETVQALEQEVEQYGLGDPREAGMLANALGVESTNAPLLGSMASKTTLSALSCLESCEGDLSKLGQIPHQSAMHYSAEFHKMIGIDPRMSGANHDQIAAVMLHATANIVKTLEAYGLNADVSRWNTPEASEFFVNSLYKAFPNAQPADREYCLRVADAYARHVQLDIQKIAAQRSQQQPRQSRQSQSQGRRSAPAKQRSSGRPKFSSNQDIFDDEALGLYELNHGRL